ncbi:putative quinol monooxygenase [Yinghuangia sp. YIM S09857]|uniref:putative quinol monooxygenase n=1 Tax=Yinghuangia sp. YIM S09857 TaxID=3436929 RepID=UPI003F5354BF
MIIVAGSLTVDPQDRDAYLTECAEVVTLARTAPGCLDFSLSPDPTAPERIIIFERWETPSAAESFRDTGPTPTQRTKIRAASVTEYEVTTTRQLT